MYTLTVELAERSYPIYIGSGLLGRDQLDALLLDVEAQLVDPLVAFDDLLR